MTAPRTRPLTLLGGLLLAAACAKGKPSTDAGTAAAGWVRQGGTEVPTPLPPLPGQHTDLRNAMILVFPDFRESRVSSVRAGFVRRLALEEEGPPLKTRLELFAFGQGFTPPSAEEKEHGAIAVKPPYEVHYQGDAKDVRLELRLPMTPEDLGKLLQSPTTPTTEHLGVQLPAPSHARPLEAPAFYFEVRYTETSKTGDLLLRRLLNGLRETGFNIIHAGPDVTLSLDADGGVSALPEALEVLLDRPDTGSRVTTHKHGREAHVRYDQRLPGN